VAQAPVIYGGLAMVPGIARLDFGDIREGMSAFLTLIVMGYASSISKGIAFGTVADVVVSIIELGINLVVWIVRGRNMDEPLPEWPIGIVTLVVSALFAVWLCLLPSS
jgi:xanthine/uracil/vitamin C permease (AzgA family)